MHVYHKLQWRAVVRGVALWSFLDEDAATPGGLGPIR